MKRNLIFGTEYAFIQFVISLLDKDEKCEQEYRMADDRYVSDLFLPKGCKALEMPKNTVIEYKRILRFDTVYKYRQLFDNIQKDTEIQYHFYLVYAESTIPQERIEQYNSANFKSLNEKTFSGFRKPKPLEGDWKKKRDDLINKANAAICTSKVCLILGAGVSIDAGLPNWNDLLKSLLENLSYKKRGTMLSKEHALCIEEHCFRSSIVMARYIIDGLLDCKPEERNRKIVELLFNILWQKYDSKLPKPLLDAIVTVIARWRQSIESIITYNYDDLLEQELNKQGVNYFSAGEYSHGNLGSIPIYHVHGIVPQNLNGGNSVVPIAVLCEDEYHELYKQAYHWSNVEQLHALMRCTCIFIGCSMGDPNLRRMLDMANSKEQRHFVFLNRKEFSFCSEHGNEENLQIQEKVMNNMGLNVIWFENFQELPRLIRDVFR